MEPLVIPLSMSRLYLLSGKDGYLQVDTGYERDYPAYRRGLARLGIDICKIKYLLLTHHHDDHAGFLNELSRDAPVRIIAHEQAASLLSDGENDRTRGGGYVNRFIQQVASLKMHLDPHWTLTFPPFILRPQDLLLTGDENALLRELGIPGQVLYTPGHCIDHLSLVLDSGEAFCGDAAANFLTWAGTRHCTVFMTDMEAAYCSWQRLLEAGAKTIYPAHGRCFPSGRLVRDLGCIRNEDLARFF
jgi:glyoxylase-like metal-dependent hydrolase (beta-lactamase superfamily II)